MSKQTLTGLIEAMAEHTLEDGSSALMGLAKVIWNKALDGDRFAIELVWERLEPAGVVEPAELDEQLLEAIEKAYNDSASSLPSEEGLDERNPEPPE